MVFCLFIMQRSEINIIINFFKVYAWLSTNPFPLISLETICRCAYFALPGSERRNTHLNGYKLVLRSLFLQFWEIFTEQIFVFITVVIIPETLNCLLKCRPSSFKHSNCKIIHYFPNPWSHKFAILF